MYAIANFNNHDKSLEEIDIQLKNRLEREKSNDNDTTSGGSNVTVIEGHVPDEEEAIAVTTNNNIAKLNVDVNNHKTVEFENESDKNSAKHNGSESSVSATAHQSNSTSLQSCLFRRDSARASVKKKVRCSETAEVIPSSNYFVNNNDELRVAEDDDEDEVFCDKIAAQVPRGNMCTPYVERKGSLPMLEALPDWFPDPRLMNIL